MTPTVLAEYTQERDFSSRSSYPAVMMSKTQRISKVGHNSGFVPDYRLAVETVGESEGFGSSCREDTEMTASEDSCAPRRKCISLNGDGCDRFGVPIQVLSVSKLSRPDRQKLELKLRTELEQIRVLQKRTAARLVNGVALSSSNDVQSGDGQKKNLAGNIQKPYESLTGHGKKRPAPSRSGGAPPKRGASGRFESVNHASCPPQAAAISGSSNAALFKMCEALLKKMMSHQFSWVFNTPVDVVKLNIPDYFNIIKHPMDLGTVNTKIESGSYSSPLDFAADVRLTFANAKTYNPSGNDVHYMADTLSKFFEVRWRAIEKKIPVIDQPPRANAQFSEKNEMSNQSMQKKKPSSAANKTNTDNSVKRIMTDSEKQKLTKDLEGLEGEIPEHIVNFLKFHCQNASEMAEDEIELDIEALSDDTLFKLRELIDDHLQGIKASQAKAEPSEVEQVLNESGVSNSSMQPCKDNDPADEDVDICGNDPLVSSRFPPVEIEKDTAQRNSKCSSSSSSSDSGSSTSDSDTGSSSGSESDQAKTSSAVHAMKDTAVSDAALVQEQSVLLDPLHGNHSLGVVDQDDETNIRPVDGDGRQEGENAPSERQVSPEKLYRAAVLLGRFADTILKAREKTLNQGERGDPEKLRLEREELEKQQREERARLQAEAKAAEDARKQAEAEAAAEARRKRELEREAARLALQQMQKTVEISENSQFLKDLEMMGSVPAEHIPSSLDETSPEHSFEGMGSFKLGKSNPLEQLGLYMKADEEEEEDDDDEEGAHVTAPAPNDVEEGEID